MYRLHSFLNSLIIKIHVVRRVKRMLTNPRSQTLFGNVIAIETQFQLTLTHPNEIETKFLIQLHCQSGDWERGSRDYSGHTHQAKP